MIDGTTADGLKILTSERGASFMDLPMSRLPEVETALKFHGVRYWVSEHILSLNGGPETTMVHFGYNNDPKAVRVLLDALGERNEKAIWIQKETTMIDTATQKPLAIQTSEGGASLLRLPFSQLATIELLLKQNGVRYWLSEDVYSYNGGPEKTIIHFGYNKTPEAVQTLLDSIQ